jgi:radical SAM superfamily enzyme YgiQ (UPF0313 family)
MLLIPPWQPQDIFPARTARVQANYWQPLGILYVAAALIEAGHDVTFYDGAFMSHQSLIQKVRHHHPAFVGIYANTFLWRRAQHLADDIKRVRRSIFTCAGGPHPIGLKARGLDGATANLDAVVTGEGETIVPALVERVMRRSALEDLPGIVFRKGRQIVVNPEAPLIRDLDGLPFPARHLLKNPHRYVSPPGTYKELPVATMMTSRGCNHHCIYCFQVDGNRTGIRFRSITNVVAEIEGCLRQGYREIRFLDDTFTADRERAFELTRVIRDRGLTFSWFASACVHQVDPPLLAAMQQAGCWAVLLGAESGVQKNLNVLRKGITPQQTRQAVKWARQAGLKVITPFLFGIPGETFADGLRTIAFACRLDPDIASFHTITPFPGTELYEKAQHYGTVSTNTEDFTFQGMAFRPFTMTRREIERLRRIAFRSFYSRPSFLWRQLRQALMEKTKPDRFKHLLLGLRSLFWLWIKGDLFRTRNGHDK